MGPGNGHLRVAYQPDDALRKRYEDGEEHDDADKVEESVCHSRSACPGTEADRREEQRRCIGLGILSEVLREVVRQRVTIRSTESEDGVLGMADEPSDQALYSPEQLTRIDEELLVICESFKCEFEIAGDGALVPWSGLIMGAVDRYLSLSEWTEESDEYRSDISVLLEQVLRSLSGPDPDRALVAAMLRKPEDETAIDALTYGLVEQGYDRPYDAALVDTNVPVSALAKAVLGARELLRRPAGRPLEGAFDGLIAELVDLYHQMTGRWPGRGFAQPPDASATPFERLALVVIPPVRGNTTLEAIRGALRRASGTSSRGTG